MLKQSRNPDVQTKPQLILKPKPKSILKSKPKSTLLSIYKQYEQRKYKNKTIPTFYD